MLSKFAVYLKGSADVGTCSLCVLPTLQLKGLDTKQINKAQFFCAETTGTVPKQVKVDSGKFNLPYFYSALSNQHNMRQNTKLAVLKSLPAEGLYKTICRISSDKPLEEMWLLSSHRNLDFRALHSMVILASDSCSVNILQCQIETAQHILLHSFKLA